MDSQKGGFALPPPVFSVLVATYNHAAFILEAVESVAHQTFTDYELIVVNDGSRDETVDLVSSFVKRLTSEQGIRCVVTSIPNSGQSAALEHGFRYCVGQWICLLDSDDRWLPEKLTVLFESLKAAPDVGMIAHRLFTINVRGERTGEVRPRRARLSSGDVSRQLRVSGRHVAPATSGIAIRRDVFGQLLPMPTKHFASGADTYLTFGASLLAPVLAIARPLAEYRIHSQGQYLRRMLSPDGLRKSVELQLTVARHFGLEHAARRNSFFARNVFGAAKFDGGPLRQLGAYGHLVRATLTDPEFDPSAKALLLLFWTACLGSPRVVFSRLWRFFQVRQTGLEEASALDPDADTGGDKSVPSPSTGVSSTGKTIRRRARIGRADVDCADFSDVVGRIIQRACAREEPGFVVTPNAQHVVLLEEAESFRRAYEAAWLVVPDGVPLLWAAALLGTPLRGRVNGTDLLEAVCEKAVDKGLRIFLLGGSPGSAHLAAENLCRRFNGLEIVGICSPPYGFELDEHQQKLVGEAVRQARPDVLFVGLGAPKQEQWMLEHYAVLGVSVMVGVGGSFELVAGLVARAPRWMQRAGLEWLFRVGVEPGRLWSRYAKTNPRFLRIVLSQSLKQFWSSALSHVPWQKHRRPRPSDVTTRR